jgi:hypothetical protein
VPCQFVSKIAVETFALFALMVGLSGCEVGVVRSTSDAGRRGICISLCAIAFISPFVSSASEVCDLSFIV